MDEFLPDLHLIWRPVEFESVGGMDALHLEYHRVIEEGGHAWWTQRLSLTYIRLLDRVLESGRTVYLLPVANPREAGQQIFRLRARIGEVLFNPDGSFVPQPDEQLPFRRSSADRIYSACWIKLVSMEKTPKEELPAPDDYLVLPYGDTLLEALDSRFSKGFILPREEYESFRKTSLARRLETLERVSRTAGEAQRRQVVTKLRDFERRVSETVAEDARSGELAFDIAEGEGVAFPLDGGDARRIGASPIRTEHEMRVDRRDRSLIIDAPDLDLDDSEERRSVGEVKVDLGGGKRRLITHTDEDSFNLTREIDDDTLGEDERQLLELGIDWDVLHRMRRKMAGLEGDAEGRLGKAAVIPPEETAEPPTEPQLVEAETEAENPEEIEHESAVDTGIPTTELVTGDDAAPTTGWKQPADTEPKTAYPADESESEPERIFRASLPTPEDIARALEGTPLGRDRVTDIEPLPEPEPETEPEVEPLDEKVKPTLGDGVADLLEEIIEPLESLVVHDDTVEKTVHETAEPIKRVVEETGAKPAAKQMEEPPEETIEEPGAQRPEPALTSRELAADEEECDRDFSFPDLPPLKPDSKRPPRDNLRGINLFEESKSSRKTLEEEEEYERYSAIKSPKEGESRPDRLLIPTVDTLLRSAEARDQHRPTVPEDKEQPLALPRDVASGIRKIREHLVIDSEQVAHIITNLLLGKHVIIGGPTGCGKSTLARLIPTLIWNIYPEIVQTMSTWGADDLLGQVYPLPDGGSAVSGVLTRTVLKNYTAEGASYKRHPYQAPNGARYDGVWLVIDELDNCDWTSLLSDFLASSDADHLRIPVVSTPGETVDIPQPQDFRLLATFNDPDGPSRMEKLSQSTRRRLAFVELHSPTDERAERHAVRRHVQSMVYEQLGLATRQSDFGDQIENTLFRFARLVRAYRDIGTAPLITILADVQVETQMGLDAWKTLDEAMATNLIPFLGGMAPGELRIMGNLAANTPERIHAYLASNLPKRYHEEEFRDQLHRYLVFLYRTSTHRRDHFAEDVKELIELVASGIPQGEVPTLVRALELREGNLATSLLPALKLGSTLFETIRGLTKLINVATGRR